MLKHSVSNFPILRKRVKLNIVSGSTAVDQAGIIRVKLPSSALCDMATFNITGKFVTAGANASLAKAQGGYSLIKRFGAQVGGVNIGYDNNLWNQTAHAHELACVGLQQNLGNGTGGEIPNDKVGTGEYITFNNFPYSVCTAGVLDTAVFGNCEIDIQLEDNKALFFADGSGGTAATWKLEDIKAYVDVIELPDQAYMMAVDSQLQAGNTYKKPVALATAVEQLQTGSNSFNVSTQSLDCVMVGVKPSAYKTVATAGANNPYSKFLNYTAGANLGDGAGKSIYIQVNSQTLPQYGHSTDFLELADMTRNVYGNSVYNYNKLFLDTQTGSYARSAYITKNAVARIQCGGEGSAVDNHGKFTGLDLAGGNSIIRVETQGLGATDLLIMVGEHSSTIEARGGQVVSFFK